MADTMAVNDVIEITVKGELYGQTILNLFHFKLIEVGAATDYVPFCNAVNAAFNIAPTGYIVPMADCMTTDYNFTQIRIQRIYNGRLAAIGFAPDTTTGSIAEAALPPGTSVSIQRTGLQANRQNIGGIRMAGVPPTYVDGGVLSSAGRLAYENFAERFPNNITSVDIGTLAPIILHRAMVPNSPLIFSTTVPNTVRTMSRRVVGRGI